jgi:hypothetical protein
MNNTLNSTYSDCEKYKIMETLDAHVCLLKELEKELFVKNIKHICRRCNQPFLGTKGQTMCDICIFGEEDKRIAETIEKSRAFYSSLIITDEKLHREFNL